MYEFVDDDYKRKNSAIKEDEIAAAAAELAATADDQKSVAPCGEYRPGSQEGKILRTANESVLRGIPRPKEHKDWPTYSSPCCELSDAPPPH